MLLSAGPPALRSRLMRSLSVLSTWLMSTGVAKCRRLVEPHWSRLVCLIAYEPPTPSPATIAACTPGVPLVKVTFCWSTYTSTTLPPLAALWLTVTVCPAMVKVPLRAAARGERSARGRDRGRAGRRAGQADRAHLDRAAVHRPPQVVEARRGRVVAAEGEAGADRLLPASGRRHVR